MGIEKLRNEWPLVVAGILGLGSAALYACTAKPAPVTAVTAATSTTACTVDPQAAANDAAVVNAANAFLDALTPAQKAAVQIEKTRANAIQWSNFPAGVVKRNGVKMADMSPAARTAAEALAKVAAGEQGAKMLAEVRAADDAFAGNDSSLFGNGLYYFSIHGALGPTSDWMLQIAGHHFVYNFTYSGKCTSATPLFDGAQPAKFVDAAKQAHDPMAAQRDSMATLFDAVKGVDGAHLAGTFNDMINGLANPGGGRGGGPPPGGLHGPRPGGGGMMNGGNDANYPSKLVFPTKDRGASVASFSPAQKALVKKVIESWVKNTAEPVAQSLLSIYESDEALAQTYVGYSGATDLTTTSSYGRIDGPRVWIEFTVQEGTTGNLEGHYHTIWRDKAADYGADFTSR